MSDFLHIACPHRATANRLQADRLDEQLGFRLLKLDTKKAQDLAAGYSIRSIPALAPYKNGRTQSQSRFQPQPE